MLQGRIEMYKQGFLRDPYRNASPLVSGHDPLGRDPFPAINTEYVNNGDRDHRIMDNLKNANEVQVGGKHYQSKYQHWDMVRDMQLDYFEGCATKYITRRKVSRKEDLEKAKHFLSKRYEINTGLTTRALSETQLTLLEAYSLANNLSYREHVALVAICNQQYTRAIELVKELIEELGW